MTIREQVRGMVDGDGERGGRPSDGMAGTFHFSKASASIGGDADGPHVLVRSELTPDMKAVIPIADRGERDVAELVRSINEAGRVEVRGSMRDGVLVGESAKAGNLSMVDAGIRSTGPDDVLDLATAHAMSGRGASR